ncbi:putative fungal-specific transcription factor [Podospora fimiseda]|uniref:Fungal-specific transcription factor n=1 Tax=Podospora fimiseda TaxID=252190 RepID=A0AAN7BS62_9PEZI|nr:putative fungal-specific transcription factor [Podospora fimiseda]
MDLLENQVSDLRSFLGTTGPQHPAVVSPIDASGPLSSHSAPGANSAQRHQAFSPQIESPGAASINATNANTTSSAKKRRSEDDEDADSGSVTNKQQRTKRNRYISIACNECKRRKIKCNGETPCGRCGHLNLQCMYAPNCCSNFKDSDEFRNVTSQVGRLQEQVESLISAMATLREETSSLRLAPIQERTPLPPPTGTSTQPPSTLSLPPLAKPPYAYRVPPSFHGPTSIAFTVDVAKTTLHKMGYSGANDSNEDSSSQPEQTPHGSPVIQPSNSPSSGDPIWEFDEAEMLHLCQLYEEEVGAMYPVVASDYVVEQAKRVSAWMAQTRRTGQSNTQVDLGDTDTLLLKVVLCAALTVKNHGHSDKAARLYESIQPTIDKMLMSDPANVSTLPILALVSGYRYLSNDEILAWRVVGHVARLCLELGLHRRDGLLKITDPQFRRNALLTFWSSYVLDRRWSFSTGLPFVCHDDKIDPNLPFPDEYPFLVAMIGYSRLSAKIWKLVDCFEPAVIRDLKAHSFEQLEQDIWDWYKQVPEQIRTDPNEGERIAMPTDPADKLQRLRIWTRLRLNQVRIWLYTPVLHSATSIVENMRLADTAVDLAKQTIRLLVHINRTTNLYRRCQVFYHQFLTSSIAVLFLASTHAPLHFSAKCREEFYMALDLVRDMSDRSWVSHRLWRTIRSLKAYAPRLGLGEDVSRTPAPVSSARFTTPSSSHMHYGGGSGSDVQSPMAGSSFSGGSGSREASRGPPSAMQVLHHQHQHHASPSVSTPLQMPQDDQITNGVRLKTEMSRIFEGYMGISTNVVGSDGSADLLGYNRVGVGGGGLGVTPGMGIDGQVVGDYGQEAVYQSLKDMF